MIAKLGRDADGISEVLYVKSFEVSIGSNVSAYNSRLNYIISELRSLN